MANLFDDLYGDDKSILELIDPATEKTENEHIRLENGKLLISTTCALLPYGVTFNSEETLQQKCREYFLSCEGPVKDKHGTILKNADGSDMIAQIRPYTLAGLASALGIETRKLKDFASGKYDNHSSNYSHIVKMAVQQIEEYAETRLYDKNGSQGARYILDSAFGRTIKKETSEVKDLTFKQKQAVAEFKVKLRALGLNQTDKDLNIVISPKKLEEKTRILNLDTMELKNVEEVEVQNEN